MIGNFIKGTDQGGNKCEGLVLDKVRTLQTISMKQPGTIGAAQSIPFALDAYLVYNDQEGTLHTVQPLMISMIGFPVAEEEHKPTGQIIKLETQK